MTGEIDHKTGDHAQKTGDLAHTPGKLAHKTGDLVHNRCLKFQGVGLLKALEFRVQGSGCMGAGCRV